MEIPKIEYSLVYSEWVKGRKGTLSKRRTALPDSDPESIPSLFKAKYHKPIYAVFGTNWRQYL